MAAKLFVGGKNIEIARVIRPARYLVFLLAAIVYCEAPLRAYTDPGTGALIWQLLVAGLVGCAFYFRRFREKLSSWRKPKKQDDK